MARYILIGYILGNEINTGHKKVDYSNNINDVLLAKERALYAIPVIWVQTFHESLQTFL